MQYRVQRNVKRGEDIALAGTFVEMDPAEAAKHPELFVDVQAERAAKALDAERAAAEAPKRLLTHLELRTQMRVDESDRKAGEASHLKKAAEQQLARAAEAERQAAASAEQVDRSAQPAAKAEVPAVAQAAPAALDLPPHKRRRE